MTREAPLPSANSQVLVTGATGFVGSHLISALQARGQSVLGGARDADAAHTARPEVHFCPFDLASKESIARALGEVERVVYLVHGMAGTASFDEVERRYAENFVEAAATRGLERVVYLGAIPPRGEPSRHLRSRLRTGEILRSGPVPVVELQATMIVGAESESFRIVRDLAARLPGMVLPAWLKSTSEPVAIDDIVAALAHALEMPLSGSAVLAAPGPEVMTGREMITRTARIMGHDPWMVDVPFLSPHLSSYWIRLVSSANPQVATELVEGLRSSIVATGPTIWERMNGYRPMPFDAAVRLALGEEKHDRPASQRVLEGFVHLISRRARRADSL